MNAQYDYVIRMTKAELRPTNERPAACWGMSDHRLIFQE
jgi:hypothetical protein